MRRIAADLGAPTTGFVRRKSDRDYIVRFFSGRNEMAMCGHVTVAIFACLADDGRISVDGGFYRQRTAAGEISVEVTEHNGRPQVVVHQPLPKFDSIQLDGATLVGPLGLDPQKVVSFGSVSAALNHVGPFLGIAPTGREVEFRFAVFVTFRDGLIAGEKFYYDLAGILRQIGALDFV